MSETDDYERQLRQDRTQKEEFFRGARSPIPPGAEFGGLEHFPPDPDLRFEVELDEHDEKEPLTVETTADGAQEYYRWGEFAITIDGEDVTLQAYKSDPDDDRLWVPFRDGTNGEETYGGGRYLDLEAPDDRVDGKWVLDLNRAYNPTCVYSDRYECPLVPLENWLDVRVEAGEKLPDLEKPDHDHGHGHHDH